MDENILQSGWAAAGSHWRNEPSKQQRCRAAAERLCDKKAGKARTRIQELLASGLAHLRTLDVIINNELARDKVIQTAIRRSLRRVQ